MKITLVIIIFLLTILPFYYKTIKLYVYTVRCLRMIKNNVFIQGKYKFVENGVVLDNIRMTPFNILYLYVVVPENVEEEMHSTYLVDHLRFLEDTMSVQNLYGLIRSSKQRFITEKEDGDVVSIYLIKFIPIIYKLTFFRFIFCGLSNAVIFGLLYHFAIFDKIVTIMSNLK